MSEGNFTPDQIEHAAVTLRDAVRAELATHPSGRSRRTMVSWRSTVAEALGRKKLLSSYFKLVVDKAVDMEILSIEARNGRDYFVVTDSVDPKHEPKQEQERLVDGPEDAIDPPVSMTGSPGPPGACNPDPHTYCYCSICGSHSGSKDPNDLYFDSNGVLCCNACNDMIPPDLRDGKPALYTPKPLPRRDEVQSHHPGEE